MRIGYIILLIVITYANHVFGQDLNNLKFTNYTDAEGLPETSTNSIIKDQRGFMWIGSTEGLFRFDGQYFKAWYADPTNLYKFAANVVTVIDTNINNQIVFISGGKIWQMNIISQQMQLIPNFNTHSFIALPIRIDKEHWLLRTNDSIFITTNNFKILYTVATNTILHNNRINVFALQAPYLIVQDYRTSTFGIYNYKTKQLVKNNALLNFSVANDFVTPKYYNAEEHIFYFAVYTKGLFYCTLSTDDNTTTNATKIKNSPGAISKLIPLRNHKLVAIGDYGMHIIDKKENTIQLYNHLSIQDKPILPPTIIDIYNDNDETLWFAGNYGISRCNIKNPTVNYAMQALGIKDIDDFRSIIKGSDNNLYYLLQNKSLHVLHLNTKKITRLDSALGYTWNAVENNGTIIATGGGTKLLHYNVKTGKLSYPNYLQPFYGKADIVTMAYVAKNGDIWYSINVGGGLVRKPVNSNTYIQYTNATNPPAFSLRYVHAVTEDNKGRLYFGTNKTHNLLVWHPETLEFTEHRTDSLIPEQKQGVGINFITTDHNNNVWIALDGQGLLKYNIDTKKGKYYTKNNGLPTEIIGGMCTDDKNRMWICTKKGLSCFLPSTERFINFTTSDGFPENAFTSNGIYFDSITHTIYVGATKSIAYFNPDSLLLKSITTNPPVFIDEVQVNGKLIYPELHTTLYLNSNENNIAFTFAAADFVRNSQLIFEYKLSTSDNDWVSLGDKRSVTFNNLREGQYTMQVRCKHVGADNWSECTYPLNFIIKTPWHKTWWFRLLSACLLAFVTWLVVRAYYLRNIEKQKALLEKQKAIEQERNRIAADMHDDLGSGLTKITYLSHAALQHSDNNLDLVKINKTSAELVENMSEIIWAMKDENNNLTDLLLYIKTYALEYCAANNLTCNINMPVNYAERIVKGENRRHIYLAIKEILHNIVKHAKATQVTIDVHYDNYWHVTIRDNGIGFSYETGQGLKNGNGLKNIHKRLAAVRGTVVFTQDNGTTCQLTIPL